MARRKQAEEQAREAAVEMGAAAIEPVEMDGAEPDSEGGANVEALAEAVSAESVAPESVSTEAVSMEQLGIEEHQAGSETEDDRVRALVEAAVYITDEPLQAAQIANALVQPLERVQAILNTLVAEYNQPHHGLYVREIAGGYQMATKAEHHEDLRQFVKKLQPPLKLSLAALETLAVIAYKQPVTAPEILEIRGVQGAGVLKTLLDRKLVQIAGRKQVLGKPALYKTTKEFLVQFGLKNLAELPTLKEFEELSRLALGDETAEVEGAEGDDGDEIVAEAETAGTLAANEQSAENRDGEIVAAEAETGASGEAAEAAEAEPEPASNQTAPEVTES